ncbi:MAG: dodecin family protein [Acidimicrobiia bacterium]|jgi:dodecin
MTESLENGAIKIIEIMGLSTTSFEDALDQAVAKAAESIKGITSLEVTRQTATVKDGKVARYEIAAKLSFVVR